MIYHCDFNGYLKHFETRLFMLVEHAESETIQVLIFMTVIIKDFEF